MIIVEITTDEATRKSIMATNVCAFRSGTRCKEITSDRSAKRPPHEQVFSLPSFICLYGREEMSNFVLEKSPC